MDRGAIVSNFINSRCRPTYVGRSAKTIFFPRSFDRGGEGSCRIDRFGKAKTEKGIFRRWREKKKKEISDDVVEETNNGTSERRARNRVKKKTKRNEREADGGTKMRDNRLQTTRSVNNTKADCGRG